jgi:hypothetical protein
MPRYEIRNTSNSALTYVEGDLPLDLMLTQAAGTYRARAMSAEEATNIVVPTLTAGTIVQTSPAIGDTLTVTGSNAPAGATFLWQVDTGGGFGAAGGTNNAATYDTTGRPEGDYRRGVSTAGQSMVYTPAVAVGAGAPAGFTLISQDVNVSTSSTTRNTTVTATAGTRVILANQWGTTVNLTTFTVDPGGPNETVLTARQILQGTTEAVALFDLVWPVTGALTVRSVYDANLTSGPVISAIDAGSMAYVTGVADASTGANPEFHETTLATTAGHKALMVVTIDSAAADEVPVLAAGLTDHVGVRQQVGSRKCFIAKSENTAGGSETFRMNFPNTSFKSSRAVVAVYN